MNWIMLIEMSKFGFAILGATLFLQAAQGCFPQDGQPYKSFDSSIN